MAGADDREPKAAAGDADPNARPSEPAVVTPKPAATVVLARDRPPGAIEIFLVQRQGSMGFMGGMHVFPGGKVCAADHGARMHARVTERAETASWGDDIEHSEVFARAVAGIRETFEEAGVLLALRSARALTPSELATLRARLLAGEDFGALLEQAGLQLDLRALQPLSRWITPESERTRFDTSFYLARAPEDQIACHDIKESVAGDWFALDEALEAARGGRIRLAPPTALTLESLLGAASVDAALALAASRTPPVVLPIIRAVGSEVVILYPGDPEHPVGTPAFAGLTRRVLRRT